MSTSQARHVLGASLFSAGGALPSHIMPILVLTWLAMGQVSVQMAGAVAAVHSLGILMTLVGLPSLGILFPRKSWLVAAAFTLLAVWVASLWLSDAGLLLAWWMAGLCAGFMQYVGALVCSQSSDKRAAFAVRLVVSLSLSLAGLVSLAVFSQVAWAPQLPLVWVVVGLAGSVLTTGLWLLGKHAPQQPSALAPSASVDSPPIGGFGVLFFLFTGQVGFYVFAVKAVTVHAAVSSGDVALALGCAKLLAGLVMYLLVRQGHDLVARLGFFAVGASLVAAVLLLGHAQQLMWVFVGFLFWELSFNATVAAFQGELAKRHPAFVGRWVSVPVFLGSALGPLVHGFLLATGWGAVFTGWVVLGALAPTLWVRWSGEAHKR